MRDRLLTRITFGLVLVVPLVSGCRVLTPVTSVPVLVRDAETKAPIPNADIQFWTPTDTFREHEDPSGTTGADGIARIKAQLPKEADVYIHVMAAGYIPDGIDRILASRVPGAPSGGAIVELFAGPRPVIELAVPGDFRGDLKVEVKIPEGTQLEPGKRVFRYAVPSLVAAESFLSTPVVHVVGSPLFESGIGPEYRGVYSNGTPMPQEPKDNEIVLRWVRSEGNDQYFVVGTRVDQESARKAAEKNIGPREPRKPSSSGGGSGRHGAAAPPGGTFNNNGIGGGGQGGNSATTGGPSGF